MVVTAGASGDGTSGMGAGDGARKEKLEKDVASMVGGALLYDLVSPVDDKPAKASEIDIPPPASKAGGPGKDRASTEGGCCGEIWGLGVCCCGA